MSFTEIYLRTPASIATQFIEGAQNFLQTGQVVWGAVKAIGYHAGRISSYVWREDRRMAMSVAVPKAAVSQPGVTLLQ